MNVLMKLLKGSTIISNLDFPDQKKPYQDGKDDGTRTGAKTINALASGIAK